MRSIAAYRILFLLAAAVLILDQLTKLWIHQNLEYPTFYEPDAIVVVPGFFNIVYVGNTGAAWSLFSGNSSLLALVGIFALCMLFAFRKALHLHLTKVQIAFGLIIGGIIGNLIDRLHLKYVIDFLDFKFGSYHFPSFNVADSGITVGVTLYILFSFFSRELKEAEQNKSR